MKVKINKTHWNRNIAVAPKNRWKNPEIFVQKTNVEKTAKTNEGKRSILE
jgi:hypothetical protein